MNASIVRKQDDITIKITGSFSQPEGEQLCKSIEAMFNKSSYVRLIFAHTGELALEVKNYKAWASLLACLNHNEVKGVCFVFDKENTPFRFLAQEYARRAAVPCIQGEKLNTLSAG